MTEIRIGQRWKYKANKYKSAYIIEITKVGAVRCEVKYLNTARKTDITHMWRNVSTIRSKFELMPNQDMVQELKIASTEDLEVWKKVFEKQNKDKDFRRINSNDAKTI